MSFILVLLFMHEMKGKILEELDQVFSLPTHIHAAYGLRQVPHFFKRYLLRQHVEPERLYEVEEKVEGRNSVSAHLDPEHGF